jgi:hypothetical protein
MTLPALKALVLERLGKDGDAADVAVSKPKHQVLWRNLYCPLFTWCSNAYTEPQQCGDLDSSIQLLYVPI